MPTRVSTPISVAIITLNEESNIKRCLESLAFASEIVVVDSGSQDRTKEIAKSMGAKVIESPWLGFGLQKQKAVEHCSNDWILSVDADEALDVEAQEFFKKFSLQAHLDQDPQIYKIARQSFHMGKWIKHGGWYPDYQTKFFNRKYYSWNEDVIHEKVVLKSDPKAKVLASNCEGKILHWVFKDLRHQIDTNNRYSTLGAEGLYQKGKRFSLLKLIFKPWSKFIETYFLKLGFLDGIQGFVISVGAAYSVFLKFSKLWELEQRAKATHKG